MQEAEAMQLSEKFAVNAERRLVNKEKRIQAIKDRMLVMKTDEDVIKNLEDMTLEPNSFVATLAASSLSEARVRDSLIDSFVELVDILMEVNE